MATNIPDLWHGIAWAADPGDAQAQPVWVDHSTMVQSIDAVTRGRQYELGMSLAAQPTIRFRDPDEYLNPANTSSPYWPYTQPYRQTAHLAVWPKGSGGNLLNLANWRVPCDPSFDSYATGSLPPFITQSNTSTGPTVTTVNPQAGTKCLTYTIPTDATNRYGIVYNVACIPGQQYTASAYINQGSASTQIIRVSDQVLVSDTFNRTSASGLGSASAPLAIGGAWSTALGVAGDRTVVAATPYSDGYAAVAISAANTTRYQLVGSNIRDVRVRARAELPATVAGGTLTYRVLARYADTSNHLGALLVFGTDGSVTLEIRKVVAGVSTLLDDYDLEGIYAQAGDQFYVDFQVTGHTIRASAWRAEQPPGDATSAPQVFATDNAITAAGATGYSVATGAGNTNVPLSWRTYSYSAVGAVEGSSTSATASYQRLSVTWTATAPTHEVTIITTAGTATAGTISIDSLMHNTGAAAGTWQATGSSIYPLFRGYLERLPRKWWGGGFNGFCEAPAVDALAAMAAITVPADYTWQLQALAPDFWWPLSGGEGTTSYPDATGNNNPPLRLNVSKFGAGTAPAGGSPMGIPGGGGATGVTFTPPSPASGNTVAGTVLGTGKLSETGAQPFAVPSSLAGVGGVWRMTVAVWVRVTDSVAQQSAFYPSKQIGSTAGRAYVPIYLDIDGSVAYSNVSSTGTIHVLSSGTGLSGINITDGQPHLLIGIVVQDTAGDTVVYRYIDDVLDGVNTATTASLGGALGSQTDSLSVGATDDGARFLAVVNGSMAHLAVWNRELSSVETALLWQAGQGNPGITSGDRMLRDLDQAGYTGTARVDIATTLAYTDGDPVATMQAPSWSGPTPLLTQAQATITAEQGAMWAAPDGAVTAEGREVRWLRLTSTYTLGEDTAGGEYPYSEEIELDFDPTYVFADVTATRPGGAIAKGGTAAAVAEAQRRFFGRRFGVSGDWETDPQAQDAADWIFSSHRAPLQRVSEIELDPAANDDLWPLVLGVEVGTRVTVKRRPKAANGGAGIVMSADYFVESVSHVAIDFEASTWKTRLTLSPIGTAPGVTQQPWILENATLGVLNSTTVLGW